MARQDAQGPPGAHFMQVRFTEAIRTCRQTPLPALLLERNVYTSQEATSALNDYLDRVHRAIPLSPSQRTPLVDKLYRQITSNCEAKAREQNRLEIGVDLIEAELLALGAPEELARHLAAEQQRWSPEAFGFDRAQFGERASAFANAATERGEHVFAMSIETAANALELAAQKLREALDKFKTKT